MMIENLTTRETCLCPKKWIVLQCKRQSRSAYSPLCNSLQSKQNGQSKNNMASEYLSPATAE